MTTKWRTTVSMATAALAFAAVQSAQASLIIDFQFDSAGTTTHKLTAADVGTDITVQVWGTVLGSGDVGIANAAFRALSQQTGSSPGAMTGGGVTTFGFTALPSFANTPAKGSAADVSSPSDGIIDLGVLTGAVNARDGRARATNDPDTGSAPGYYLGQGGWTTVTGGAKIELGTYKVHIGSLTQGGVTKFNVGLPENISAAGWFENAAAEDAQNGLNPTTGTYTPGTAVSFITPTYKYALTTHGNATLGTTSPMSLTVVGNNGKYYDPVVGVPTNGTTSSVHISNSSLGVGGEVPVLVMVEFNLGASGTTLAQLAGFLNDVSIDTPGLGNPVIVQGTSPDQRMADLLGAYGSFNANNTLLFEYNTAPNSITNGLDFGFDLSNSGISVTRVIAVPEPASLGMLALGAVGLLKRRRR